MNATETMKQDQTSTYRYFHDRPILKFAIFETIILLGALSSLALLTIELNSVALPVSIKDGNVISFVAGQSINMSDLLWPIVIISICVSAVAALFYTKFFPHFPNKG